MAGLNLAQLRLLSSNLYHYFKDLDTPPADEIVVPVNYIKKDHDEPNTYYSTIRFIVEYCGRKVHNIKIKFNIDEKGRFLNNTWSYV